MGEMDLIYLVLGIGLGLIMSRFTRSNKQSVISTVSSPHGADSEASLPKKADSEVSSPQKADSDELQPLKEELKQTQLAYEMAKEMSQFKAGFLARTSHELRSPLSSLIGLHQLILQDLCDSPEEERQFVAQANTSALKMVKVLDDLVKVSKTEHGTNRLELRSFPLARVFEDVHRLTHMLAANRNLQLEVISPDPDVYVLADQQRFQQVLLGIVDSAIAQMEDGSIRISATSWPESKEVHIGFDVQCQTVVWSESIDLLTTIPEIEKQPGETPTISAGLNLLIVQTLVEVMQGRLEVLPASGEGSNSDSTTEEKITRLRCSMPLGTPEIVELALAQD